MTEYSNGIHNISNDSYHAANAVSRSALMKLAKSPYHYWYEYINPDFVKPEPTPDMILGSLTHTMTLESDKIGSEYALLPNINRRTNAGKEEYAQFLNENAGKTIVSRETYEQAHAMRAAVLNDETAASLIHGARIEESIFFTHAETGLQCKARPDARNGTVVTDLKTTADASYKAFQSSAYKYGFFLQSGMIKYALNSIGMPVDKFVFVCVEKKEPFAVAVYVLDDAAVEYGVSMFEHLMQKLKACRDADNWPGYEIQTLCVPRWAEFEE